MRHSGSALRTHSSADERVRIVVGIGIAERFHAITGRSHMLIAIRVRRTWQRGRRVPALGVLVLLDIMCDRGQGGPHRTTVFARGLRWLSSMSLSSVVARLESTVPGFFLRRGFAGRPARGKRSGGSARTGPVYRRR